MNCKDLVRTIYPILFYLFCNSVYSQEKECYIRLRGIAEESRFPSIDVNVKLYEGNKVVDEKTTDFNGDFEFRLDTGKRYTVVITKPGFITKKLAFVTDVPKDSYGIWTNDFAVRMVKKCEGVDLSELEQPIDEIKYHIRSQSFKSDAEYTRKMFNILDNIYYKLDNCHFEKYNELIKKAEDLYNLDNLSESKDLFREASEMMPSENYPRKRMYDIIAELQKINADIDTYQDLKSEGDKYFAEEKFKQALEDYEKAYEIKKNDPDLLAKMNQSRQKVHEELIKLNNEKLAVEKEVQQQEQQFNAVVAQAEDQYKNNLFTEAKSNYQKALLIKPDDAYVKSRLNKLDNLIEKQELEKLAASQRQKETEYNQLISQASNLQSQKQFEFALKKYKEALVVKPGDVLAQQKINEITTAINLQQQKQLAEQQKEKQYQDIITQGNNLLALGELVPAKQKYMQASTLKPGDTFATSKINEINQRIEQEKQQQLAEQQNFLAEQEKKKQYQEYIDNGNTYINNNQFEMAKAEFQKALQLVPQDAVSRQKINQIDQLIQQQELAFKQKQEKDNAYNANVKKGENLLALSEYEQARQSFQQALLNKPGDAYATQKIGEINNTIQKQQQEELAKLNKENQYKQLIVNANNMIQSGDLVNAKTEFQKALNLKPGDPVASAKIREVDQLINQKQQQELMARQQGQKYNDLIKKADNFYNSKNYNDALTSYQQALALKPSETYPATRVNEITNIIEENQKAEQQKEEYENALKLANNYYNKSDYDNAKTYYQKALTLQPNSSYPKQQLEKIAKAQSLVAQNNQASSGSKGVLAELKFRNDTERTEYLTKLSRKYPDGITLEVYKEEFKTTYRYIIIREGQANEYREVRHSWGGIDYTINDRAVNNMYFQQQTKKREGEYFKQFDM